MTSTEPVVGTGLQAALTIAGAGAVGLMTATFLRVKAKRGSDRLRRLVQALEIRLSLLAVVLFAVQSSTSLALQTTLISALCLLTVSLLAGYDGNNLSRVRTLGLFTLVASYAVVSTMLYYRVGGEQLQDLFQSHQIQMAGASLLLYFILQPILANHESCLDSHLKSIRELATWTRDLDTRINPNGDPAADRNGDPGTVLVVPLETARTDLRKRQCEAKEIAKGLDNSYIPDRDASGKDAEHWYWHTRGLLERWFSTDSVAQEFATSRGGEVNDYRDVNYENVGRVQAALKSQIACIEGILRRLEVYDLPLSRKKELAVESERPNTSEPTPSHVTYTFSGPVGQLIAGEGQTIRNIRSHIAAVVGQGQQPVGDAIQRLSETALSDPDLDDAARKQVLESIEDLADAAEAPPAERKVGRIRGALATIGQMAGVAAKLGEVWSQWEPVITEHLGSGS